MLRDGLFVNEKKGIETMSRKTLKPIIKWAGGKGQLIGEISALYPQGLGVTVRKYAEPFVGGGAVLFDILSKYDLDEVYISDINAELINMYRKVKRLQMDWCHFFQSLKRVFSHLMIAEGRFATMRRGKGITDLFRVGRAKTASKLLHCLYS